MDFFGREDEIKELRRIREVSRQNARFTVITGRRRVGKTELVKKAFEDKPYLYFYITKKAQPELCEEFRQIVEKVLDIPFPGRIERFSDILRFILERSIEHPLTLFIDEFQDFLKIDESIIGDFAREWDAYHLRSKINLVVCGSIDRLMGKIFKDDRAPLYGRNTAEFRIEPFGIPLLKDILFRHKPDWSKEDLLALWTFTGGIARHVSLLMDDGATSMELMVESMVRLGSPFLGEGKSLLVEEFGKDYGGYFTILSSIAAGRTRRAEIEQSLGGSAGGYITKLEDDYGLVNKRQPMFEKSANKNCVYLIKDNFLRFWFRFMWKYAYLLELRYYGELREIIARDYKLFSGLALEGYFREKFASEHAYTKMGAWWDRKGENEIDLVCENEFKGVLDFYEVKRDSSRINIAALERKAEAFLEKNPEFRSWKRSCFGLSMDDM
ncbi:MAG: ATP-binding protein [Kiritimatiellae bacterium]|nr:ATP-binding protein [Kiritimatiellia bacterium]